MSTLDRLGPAALRHLHVHRHAALFRPLEGDERDRLRDSLQHGYDPLHPIVVAARSSEIVDGRNRRDLAVELGIDALVLKRDFADDAEIATFIAAENLARRHLDQRERRELAGRLVVNGTSTRQAARATGVSEATARRAAADARVDASPDAPAAERVNGRDGKSYPATRSRRKPATSKNRSALLAELGVAQLSRRLRRFVDRDLGSRPLSAAARGQAAQYAGECRAMAATFDALASGQKVDAREGARAPAETLGTGREHDALVDLEELAG
jgi:transposase